MWAMIIGPWIWHGSRNKNRLEEIADQYNSADSGTQSSVSDILAGAGLGDIDLGSLSGDGLSSILGDLGNNLAVDDLLGLVEEAFASGSDMIGDALGGGLGTSDGSSTATTKPAAAGGSPNVIVADTKPVASTSAVGVPQLTTKAPADPAATTAANIVGAGVTTSGTTAPAVTTVDDTMSSSTVAVLVVLSVSTIAVIVAIVIFFIMKKK